VQAGRVEPGIDLSHDIHRMIHQDGPLSRTRRGHGQHIPAIPIGKIVHDRSTLADLYAVVLVKKYTRSINSPHEPLLPLPETPTFHIGDDLLLEWFRIILLKRHD
jgi:hypothetical protein